MKDDEQPDYHALLKEAYLEIRRLKGALRESNEPIAVIGMGCRFPGDCDSPEKLHAFLLARGDASAPVPPERGDWSATDSDHGSFRAGFAGGVDEFDPVFFGISPREAEAMDPQQRLLLTCAWEALERAGLTRETLRGSRTGVFTGIYNSDYAWLRITGSEPMDAHAAAGMEHAFAPNRISHFLDLRGPSIAVNTACSSSLTALHYAIQSLRNGECNLAVVGAVNLILSPLSMLVASRMLQLSPEGKCRTFDAAADGILRGEGCGVMVLQRLNDAERDERSIHALVAGTAINQDGRTNVLTAPSGRAQEEVIREALRIARVDPDQVAFVETHGTGTPLGDPIEFGALREVYGKGDGDCVLGAVKTNMGHLEPAAGMAGLIKTIRVLESGEIPPNLHLEHLNPEIDPRGTRLVFPRETVPWPADSPRIAGVSAFGAGGVNAHAVLMAAPGDSRRDNTPREDGFSIGPLPLSATSAASLRRLAGAYEESLRAGADFEDFRRTASRNRDHHTYRIALAAKDRNEALELLSKYLGDEPDERIFTGRTRERPPLAFVFSGQGTEFLNMAAELLDSRTEFRRTFEECDDLIQSLAGWSLREASKEFAAGDDVMPTRIAQPLLCSLHISLLEFLKSLGYIPDAVIGHSLGELSAAHAAGILDRRETLRLALRRGELMEDGVGCMAAFEMSEDEARAALGNFGEDPGLAAVNGPNDVVLAGTMDAMNEFKAQHENRLRRVLNTRYAFHGPGMERAAREFRETDAPVVRDARRPFYSTVSGRRMRGGEFDIAHLARGIRETVRFADGIQAMIADGLAVFVELSPRPALLSYIKETANSPAGPTVLPTLRKDTPDTAALRSLCAALYRAGIEPDWSKLHGKDTRVIPIPTRAWENQRFHLPGSGIPGKQTLFAEANETPAHHDGSATLLELFRKAAPDEKEARSLELARAYVGEVLRLPPERVDADTQLHLQGLGSLGAAELRTALRRDLGVNISAMRLVGGLSARELAVLMAGEKYEGEKPRPVRVEIAPASILERVLTRLFGEALNRPDYESHRSIHEMGGGENELKRLHELMSVQLPFAPDLEVLRAAPSPTALAAEIYRISARSESKPPFITRPVENQDAELLLFCFPHGGGNADFYRGWELDKRVELISLQPPGQGQRFMEAPVMGMDDYLDMVAREFEPLLTKPWATFGHSMGTLIAFEFARRIHRKTGDAPRHMIVSAGPAPTFIAETIGNLDEAAVRETIRKGIPEAILNDRELRDLFVPALLADIARLNTYVYQDGPPLDCDMTVLAGQDDELVQMKHSRAWRDFTRGEFDFRTLPGGHHYAYTHRRTLLDEINSILAKIIR